MPLTIQRGEILQRIARALGVKERSPAAVLATAVQPVILVADARDEPLGAVERSFFTYETITAVAGQVPAVQCYNPLGSGIDVAVDFILVSSTTALQQIDYRITGQVLANLTTKATQYRDTTVGQPVAQGRSESLAAAVLGAGNVRVTSTNSAVVPVELRFTSGQGLLFCGQTAAGQLTVTFFGREIVRPYR